MVRFKIKDKIYGYEIITEPLIIDLIKSQPFQRLKKLNQFGIPNKYYHIKNFSRYEHSLGVMILIKRLGGSVQEQVAGLLHDLSHTAFSHLVDWVIGDAGGNESYQDNRHEKVINSNPIKGILLKHGYDPKIIADYHNYKLLEKDAPDLCADRVDYAFREFPVSVSKKLFKSLINKDNEIVMKDERSAFEFGKNFLKLQRNHWGGYQAVTRYRLLSNILKFAIKNKIINFNQFLKDDEYVIDKLIKSKNNYVVTSLKILTKKKIKLLKNNEIVFKKFRYVDPKFIVDNCSVRLSEYNSKYKELLDREIVHNKKGVKVSILRLHLSKN
jgi:hypothetical protein